MDVTWRWVIHSWGRCVVGDLASIPVLVRLIRVGLSIALTIRLSIRLSIRLRGPSLYSVCVMEIIGHVPVVYNSCAEANTVKDERKGVVGVPYSQVVLVDGFDDELRD